MNQEIQTWLDGQHPWLQEAATRVLSRRVLDDVDIADLAALVKLAAPKKKAGAAPPPARKYPSIGTQGPSGSLRLISIGDIAGIDILAPRHPLGFGTGNLTVIYGNNGSGKSGYVRILRKACGKHGAPELKVNVYQPAPSRRNAAITYELGGVQTTCQWEPSSGPIEELAPVDIFDASTGRLYVDAETEATYAPAELAFFADLADVCKRVDAALQAEQNKLVEKLPVFPAKYSSTQTAKTYNALRSTMTSPDLATAFAWTPENEEDLKSLSEKLKMLDPAAAAKARRALKTQIEAMRTKLLSAVSLVSPAACVEMGRLAEEAAQARQAAEVGTKVLSASSELLGVNSTTWRALWEAARAYSTGTAYLGRSYPNLEDGARCVLCHQVLDSDARVRLANFEAYVTGELESRAKAAEADLAQARNRLPASPFEEDLRTAWRAAELPDESIQSFTNAWADVAGVVTALRLECNESVVAGLAPEAVPVLAELDAHAKAAEAAALVLDADATGFDRAAALAQVAELEARQWASGQFVAIEDEVARLRLLDDYAEWRKKTNTKGITSKAGEVAEKLITTAYMSRFNSELRRLGAEHIRVELVKGKATVGRPKHRIQLKGQVVGQTKAVEVLSEGEGRIVALAAFLADVTGRPFYAPFVFDDPISSLDQLFEEQMANRLVELSAERQVVVFTHRLSLVSLINEKSPQNAEVAVHLTRDDLGTGQPGDTPLFAKRPEAALNKLKNERLPIARKLRKSLGEDAYYPLAKALCSDIRVLMERIVEVHLLSDVVGRHRRAVNTLGKIDKLVHIEPSDCQFVERIMTKYSAFEHSQSLEFPVGAPAPEELEADIEEIATWIRTFEGRKNGTVKP